VGQFERYNICVIGFLFVVLLFGSIGHVLAKQTFYCLTPTSRPTLECQKEKKKRMGAEEIFKLKWVIMFQN
jgi:hypothetical protein